MARNPWWGKCWVNKKVTFTKIWLCITPSLGLIFSVASFDLFFQEFCFGYDQTNFKIPVPLHATPSFNLKACQLSW